MGDMAPLCLRNCLIIESGPKDGDNHRFIVMNETVDHDMITLIPIVTHKEQRVEDADKLFHPILQRDGNDHILRRNSFASFLGAHVKRLPAGKILESIAKDEFRDTGKQISEKSFRTVLDAFLASGAAVKQQKIALGKVKVRMGWTAER